MEKAKNYIKSDSVGLFLLLLIIAIITIMLILSILIPNKEISQKENRALAKFPSFSISTFFAGEFFEDYDEYFSDHFPFRDGFLAINEKIEKITSQFAIGSGDDSVVVIDSGERDLGGESIEDVEGATK